MARLCKIYLPLAALVLMASSISSPARAQFGGGGDGMAQMEQMAPMLNMMKRKMGKKRFGQLMQTVGPMFDGGGGGGAGFGGFGGGSFGGGGGFGGGGFDVGSMMGMMGSMDIGSMVGMFDGGSRRSGRRGKARRYSSW
jgi:hypothetical protein